MTGIANLDQLLASDDLNGSVIELDNFIGEFCSYGDEMDNLTEPQRKFYLNQNLEREVNNGGFNQYFINSSGDFAHETIDSLKEIGANRTAQILQRAIDLFPEQRVPKNRQERINVVIDTLPDIDDPVWEKLDEAFFRYEEDLNALNIEFVRKHRDAF